MFKKILIANRGEIAVRVAQTVQEMGIAAVAVFSEPDRHGVHVTRADEAYPLEGAASAETYLRIDKIIDIAKKHHVDAIHPGFGFLSENEDFAQACADAGIVFIGPSPSVIRDMGDKIIAKERFSAAGVPVVPGWSGAADVTLGELKSIASRIGYPVLIKAAAGGGGKGMRVVRSEAELQSSIDAARREADSAFGDARVFMEKYVTRPRHIEFQIFGDSHGNVVHLFDRECSIQRRHQKIVEESPSPALSDTLRATMGEAAVRAAKAIGYVNAGTVEFILDESGSFYFLEVNTRLQVEHPVTEMVVEHDLVRAQIMVASGGRLPFAQDDLTQTGHAIECRIYAEDASRQFMPSTGRIEHYVEPTGPGIRVDSGVRAGSEVTVHYDPMLAKLVAWARSRDEAISRIASALRRYVVLGVTTNIEFLHRVVTHPAHVAGRLHTHFLDEHAESLCEEVAPPPDLALAAATLASGRARSSTGRTAGATSSVPGPWEVAGHWRA
ncbi:MAG: acetyl-CoA carboxylase biotin carboxylase subunit, partial [Phycisphaerae bacterium]|nr:acetyl-CoA carboxylase biotin carboxylase subunit [Phycisphaerae bacterium]